MSALPMNTMLPQDQVKKCVFALSLGVQQHDAGRTALSIYYPRHQSDKPSLELGVIRCQLRTLDSLSGWRSALTMFTSRHSTSGHKSGNKSRKAHDSSKDKSSKCKKDKRDKSSKDKKDKKNKKAKSSYIDLYCAIYAPHFGNYYHWAFVTYREETAEWHIFQVVQDFENGPFRSDVLRTNPTNSARCRQPLLALGQIHPGWWETLFNNISILPVPGEGVGWNCQDYVMEIWEGLYSTGMIVQETWENGYYAMVPYYGQDFGGDYEDEDAEEDEDEDEEDMGNYHLSEEFVYDSD